MQSLPYGETLLRLVSALVVGGAIGLDRFLHGKPAGVRTHALVTLSAALVTLIGIELGRTGATFDGSEVSRIIQGIITGVGFVGGGVILQNPKTKSVRGLTTAVSLWLSACLGIGCGAGAWAVSLTATVLVLLVLSLGGRLERSIERWVRARFPLEKINKDEEERPGHVFADEDD